MKNIKLNKKAQGGFSLVEMLVVIAVIGIIAAIAIPNIGSINDSARKASAQRNAQSIASVLNAAIAAGASTGWTAAIAAGATATAIVDKAEAGISPTDGAFVGKTFTTGEIDNDEERGAASFLSYDATNNQVIYNPTGSYSAQ
jgi:prepilin-type N-terminal cleavage/methylation domain-containing protein